MGMIGVRELKLILGLDTKLIICVAMGMIGVRGLKLLFNQITAI